MSEPYNYEKGLTLSILEASISRANDCPAFLLKYKTKNRVQLYGDQTRKAKMYIVCNILIKFLLCFISSLEQFMHIEIVESVIIMVLFEI